MQIIKRTVARLLSCTQKFKKQNKKKNNRKKNKTKQKKIIIQTKLSYYIHLNLKFSAN